MSLSQLKNNIIPLSISDDWDIAKTEWSLFSISEVLEAETCLCGHYPIKKICILRNRYNNTIIRVGNCCVKKFIGLPSHLLFNSISKVKSDLSNSFNQAALDFVYSKKIITDWEYNFLSNTSRIRNLTIKEYNMRIKLNKKILGIS